MISLTFIWIARITPFLKLIPIPIIFALAQKYARRHKTGSEIKVRQPHTWTLSRWRPSRIFTMRILREAQEI